MVTALSQGYQQLGAQRQDMVRSFLARKIDAARADASADLAAVVAYNAASETAPRWVWLDEAMTGVDAASRHRSWV